MYAVNRVKLTKDIVKMSVNDVDTMRLANILVVRRVILSLMLVKLLQCE